MQNKHVRDLAWVINSPSLIKQQPGWPNVVDGREDNWTNQWLRGLTNDSSALQNHLKREKSHFIGAYFESLWAFYLLSNPKFDLIAKNLQANSKERTEGEFDFIVLDNETGQYIHQEIAIKFYLGFSKENDYKLSDGKNIWLGPQCKDRLDLKMDKMLNTQVKLSDKASGKNALRSVNIDTEVQHIETQLLLKGYLFYPQNRSVVAPNYCNPLHLNGQWIKLAELTTYIEENIFDAWALLTKSEWVSPYTTETIAPESQHDNLFTHKSDAIKASSAKIISENRPWMIACLTLNEKGYIEAERLFVVPDSWPRIDERLTL